MFEQVDLNLSLTKPASKAVLKFGRQRLFELARQVYDDKIPVIIVFEGWDAAGKGTNIRRLTRRLDPRGFKVISTQAPRTHELKMPWLWRFWMQIPRRGQMAIFDRSWYGRVLVERVEGLTPIPDWIRAYEEINQFERTLADDGTVFVKLWLHISKQEQLRRFIYLTQNQEYAWQVTAEDWEHHRKYDEYMAAVRDMVTSTHTAYAPWEIVPATDKNYTTYHIFRTVIRRLEEVLGVSPTEWPDLVAMQPEGEASLGLDDARSQEKRKKRVGGLPLEPVELEPVEEAGNGTLLPTSNGQEAADA
jgi:polyphosphate kinase 2 (PPK2 family)